MLLAEFTLDHPILRSTLADCPDAHLDWEDSYITPANRMQILAWLETDDYDTLDAAIAADPTVEHPTVLTAAGGRRLYRFDVVGDGREASIMPLIVEHGGTPQEITASHEGWWNRIRFPNRDALKDVFQYCRDHGVTVTFHRVFEQTEFFDDPSLGLTDAQRDILVHAVDSGYLEIPRDCTLAELGDRLGISETAASERFRRAVHTLIRQTVPE